MTELATFAGGCFWCMVKPFDQWPGVLGVVSGYTGGNKVNPSYEDVCSGTTGHYEAVQITFDPAVISYRKLLEIYWQQVDPTDGRGQFYDRGPSYKPAIFYHTAEQKAQAGESRQALSQSGRFDAPIAVEILPATVFYAAEAYHQDFYKTHAEHYRQYRQGSGRDLFLQSHWESR